MLRVAALALGRFRAEAGDPIPRTFNRRASAHRVSARRYSKINSLVSLMLMAGSMRELDFWLARPEEGARTEAA